MTRRTSILLASLLTVGCGDPAASGSDGGIELPDVAIVDDAAVGPTRYGPCTSPGDCRAEDTECNITYPGGMCTSRCTTDGDCRGDGVCWGGTCSPTCTLGANECRNGYCLHQPTHDFCVAACYSERARPSGWPTCVDGLVCDPWESFCVPPSHPLPPPGGDTGAACANNAACSSGSCLIYETWLDGYCISYARQAPDSAFVVGHPLPQSSCPDGAVVLPSAWFSLTSQEGDWLYCAKACSADSECRAGYECMGLQDEGDGLVYSVGGCSPTDDCMNPAHACPTGHTCVGNTAQAHCE